MWLPQHLNGSAEDISRRFTVKTLSRWDREPETSVGKSQRMEN
jgi:hypothetical protein